MFHLVNPALDAVTDLRRMCSRMMGRAIDVSENNTNAKCVYINVEDMFLFTKGK